MSVGRWGPWAVVTVAGLMAMVALGIRAFRIRDRSVAESLRSVALPRDGTRENYATSASCRACHPQAYASWHRTYHRTMTQVATPQAVLGLFDGTAVDAEGRYVVGRTGEYHWVEIPAPEGERIRRPVVLTTGSHHMQVYWITAQAGDRLVAFPWAWLNEERKWVPNEFTLLRPPDDAVEYTWNRVCIKCHVVAGVPGWSASSGRVDSEVAELGIACEACHGPAHAHAERHRNPLVRYMNRGSARTSDDIFNPGRADAGPSSQVCGQCHAITFFHDDDAWVRGGHDHPPPARMEDWGRLVRHPLRADQPWMDAVLEENPDFFVERFWPDGMVRVSGREYNGLVESACHQRGELSCLSCHSMHDAPADDQLVPAARTDEVCLACHTSIGANVRAHTHHLEAGGGPSCYDCHMPHTTYGLLKAIRSHEIDSPRVQVTLETGRPNACNLCHLDRTLAWTAEHLRTWYGQPMPEIASDEPPVAAGLQWLLAGDAGQRALLAWHFGWAPAHRASGAQWQASALRLLLDDPYPAVRIVAARALLRLDDLDAQAPSGFGPRSDPRQVLHAPDGSWDIAAANGLYARRDGRPVALAE